MHTQLALQAQILELLQAPGCAAELRTRLDQASTTTVTTMTYAPQTAMGTSGPTNQTQGSGNTNTNR